MPDQLAGYWPSPWPAEDGGPLRQQAPDGIPGTVVGFDLSGGRSLRATTRNLFAPTMCVLRDPGEVFLLCHTVGPDSISWVERIDPESLACITRSADLPGGPFWPGGMAAHADGSLYVTFGRWCHRLDAQTLEVVAARELPRDRAYNSFVVLPSGHLVMKDIGGGEGMNRLPDGLRGSELVVLEPGTLEIVASMELTEGSIARLSADGNHLYVVGVSRCFRVTFDPATSSLTLDEGWQPRYRTIEGQTFGWDIVLARGSGWFLDNGEGSDEFGGSFRGKGKSTAPLHLVRVSLAGEAVTTAEVCGIAGGVVANPPCVDADRGIVVGYDSAHGVMTAWRFDADGEGEEGGAALTERWRRDQHHGGHMLRFPDSGQLVTYDYDHDRGIDQVVVLDIDSGRELARVDTGSPVQSVLFPAPGWQGDAYVCTFAAVTRVFSE
jgi:hypothetical protein